ncbi:SAM-dependent methyltransferase, partial [Streptomyces sp. SP17BM10]
MHAVSYTAQWMAAARAQESEREDALFTDPLARDLAAPKGFELIERY